MGEDRAEDRRTFLRRAATMVWATPLVLTLSGGRAGAQALSCMPNGLDCGLISQGGICNQFANCCGVCVYPGTGITCRCTAPF